MDWNSLVPEFTLRPQQIDALNKIQQAFDEGVNVVILEAPTGVGKSIIQLALCRTDPDGGFIVTPQKTLQDQLGRLPGVKVMKGKASYSCMLVRGHTAATAPCVKNSSVRESNSECSDSLCPYYRALDEAKKADIVTHNYASLIAQTHIGGHFSTRGILCLDEGHSAAEWIRNYMSMEWTHDDLSHITSSDPPQDTRVFMGWFRAVMSELTEIPGGLPERISSNIVRILAHKKVYGVPENSLAELHAEAMSGLSSGSTVSYIRWATEQLKNDELALTPWSVETFENSDGAITYKMVPIKIAAMANILTSLGVKVVVVTATVLDADLLARELGVKGKGYQSVVIDSAFKPESRPLVRRYVGRMGYNHIKSTMPKLIDGLAKILDEHRSESGIIHTTSHNMSFEVFRGLSDLPQAKGRQLIRMPKEGRDSVIYTFLNRGYGPNAVLIGPALMEGIDGVDDSARWQAICKVPWLHRKDPVVSFWLDDENPRNKAFGQKWYLWKTTQMCVQGFGRVCRSDRDFGVTYLMDPDFDRILEKNDFMPDYVLDALVNHR